MDNVFKILEEIAKGDKTIIAAINKIKQPINPNLFPVKRECESCGLELKRKTEGVLECWFCGIETIG